MVWRLRFFNKAVVFSIESNSIEADLKGKKAASLIFVFVNTESSKRTFSINKSFSTLRSPVFCGAILRIIPSCRPVSGRVGLRAIRSASVTPSFFSRR